MEKPKCAEAAPVRVELEPGTYWWCACGLSAKQPFCDGSHKGTSFEPVKLELKEAKRVSLCQCKITQKAPYCDGSHAEIDE
jgi:CDGSH-type Zn-finger protein